MRFLEKFLDALASHPLIRNSKILQEFLSIENENEFSNLKKEHAKLKPPVKLTELKSLNGEVTQIDNLN